MKRKEWKSESGFTLVELLVAVAIFTPLILMVVSSFLSLDDARRTLANKETVMNELQYNVNLIGKEVLAGSIFPSGCQNGCSTIAFETTVRSDTPSYRVDYKLDPSTGQLLRAQEKTFGPCSSLDGNPGVFDPQCFSPMTSDRIDLTNAEFFVERQSSDGVPKRNVVVTLVLDGAVGSGEQREDFQISSTFSPRESQNENAQLQTDNRLPSVTILEPTSSENYSTEDTSIILEGEASDNNRVDSISWYNEVLGEEDASGQARNVFDNYSEWDTANQPIDLTSGFQNVITVTARDPAGNTFSDTITVDAQGPLEAPVLTNAYGRCHPTNDDESVIPIDFDKPYNSRITMYRCDGDCTPTEVDADYTPRESWLNRDTIYYVFDAPNQGGVHSFRAKVEYDGEVSGWSNVLTATSPTFEQCANSCYGGRDDPDSNACRESCTDCSAGGGSGGGGGDGDGSDGGDGTSGDGDEDTIDFDIIPSVVEVGVNGNSGTFSTSPPATIEFNPDNIEGTALLNAESDGLDDFSGVSYGFNPNNVDIQGGESDLRITVPNNTTPGSYNIQVGADGGGYSGAGEFDLVVKSVQGGEQ